MNRSHSNKRIRRNLSCILLLLGWLIAPDAVSSGATVQQRLSQCQHIVLKTDVRVNYSSVSVVESIPLTGQSMSSYPDLQYAASLIRLWGGVPNSEAWRASLESKITPYVKNIRREYTFHTDESGPENNPSMYPDVKNWCGLEFVLEMIPAPGNDRAVTMKMNGAFQKLIVCHGDCTSIDFDPRRRDGDSGHVMTILLPLSDVSSRTGIRGSAVSRMDQLVHDTIESLVNKVIVSLFRS